MNNSNPTIPAFPRPEAWASNPVFGTKPAQEGMSLRDYFAAQAVLGGMTDYWNSDRFNDPTFKEIAETAYCVADAMLKAREA